MDEKTFRELGFKCGLEIHQQLLTERKLFCNCPAGYRNDMPDAEIIRHMRPTLSELGEYDGTALMEFKTRKRVIYQLYRDNMCTYEMDDTPPFLINKNALEIAIKLALMLNCAIVDELHVSRKQYLDGSIPTGFQRTAVVGVGGWVPYKDRKIMLSHVCVEEDACREVADVGHDIIWKTDRLSMPLLEVITEPMLETPREVREVNELIGRLLKASGLVRRGIGSVRQDVNVSITGGTRVEMKGISKTGYVDKLTAIEALRQKHLLEIRDELKRRGLDRQSFRPVRKDVTSLLTGITSSSLINRAIDTGYRLGAVVLPGFGGLLKKEIQPGRTFADEFAGRVKVIACLDNLPNIAVSEITLPEFGEAVNEVLKKEFDAGESDVIVLTWGSGRDVVTAIKEIIFRAEGAFDGVPNETRQHLKDYTTGFERILPGPNRMYPDTDSPPVEIKACVVSSYEKDLPKRAYDIERRWQKLGVPESIAHLMVVSPLRTLFDNLASRNEFNQVELYIVLKKAFKVNVSIPDFNPDTIAELFESNKQGRLSQADVIRLMVESTPETLRGNFEKLVESKQAISDSQLTDAINQVFGTLDGSDFRTRADKLNYLTGQVLQRLDGVSLDGGRVKGLIEATL
jgi:glutamyl-tRNA(Gln) amidotransferase subunit E